MDIIKHIREIAGSILIGTISLMGLLAALSVWDILPGDMWWPSLLTLAIIMFSGWSVIAVTKRVGQQADDDKHHYPWITQEVVWALAALFLIAILIFPSEPSFDEFDISMPFGHEGDVFYMDDYGFPGEPVWEMEADAFSADPAVLASNPYLDSVAYEAFDGSVDKIDSNCWIAPKALGRILDWQDAGLLYFDPSNGHLTVETESGTFERGPFTSEVSWQVIATGKLANDEVAFSYVYEDDAIEEIRVRPNGNGGLTVVNKPLTQGSDVY